MSSYNGPKYSCPDWDAAIEHIENARSINAALRDDNEELAQRVEELEKELEIAQDEAAEAESEVKRLKGELAAAEAAYDELKKGVPA